LNLHERVGIPKTPGRLARLILASALFAPGCSDDATGTVEMKGDRDSINRQLIAPGKSEGTGTAKTRKKGESFEGKVKGPGSKSL